MTSSSNLNLPNIAPSQAQKHITYNAAITQLDQVVPLSVVSHMLNAPPNMPEEVRRYIIGSAPTGLWVGKSHSIADYIDGLVSTIQPGKGGGPSPVKKRKS